MSTDRPHLSLLRSLAICSAGLLVVGCTMTVEPRTRNPHPTQPEPAADVPLSVTVMSEPRSAGPGRSEIQIRADGPTVEAVRTAARDRAAQAVVDGLVDPRAFELPAWAQQVDVNTQIVRGGSPIRLTNGGQRLEVTVQVNQTQLVSWAAQNGFARDMTSVTGDMGNAPEPSIVAIPTTQRGAWPAQLSNDDRLVQSIINRALMSDPYGLRMRDYADVVEALGALERDTGTSTMNAEFIIAADITIRYDVTVETPRPGQVRANIKVLATLMTTGDIVFDNSEHSETLAAAQRTRAIEQAAESIVQAAVRDIAQSYNREYSRGIPYQIRFTNAHSLRDAQAVRQAMQPFIIGTPNEFVFRDGVCSFWVRAEPTRYGDPFDFLFATQEALEAAGYGMRNESMNRRFLAFELTQP